MKKKKEQNCEIKFVFLKRILQDKKTWKVKIYLLFGLLSPNIAHCIFALYIHQTSPIGRNTCSAIDSNILLASNSQFLNW